VHLAASAGARGATGRPEGRPPNPGRRSDPPHLPARTGRGRGRIPARLGAARHGRVDTPLLAAGATLAGRHDAVADTVTFGGGFADAGENLLDAAAAWPLRGGGSVHVLAGESVPGGADAAAILRY
jgi:hypothetical protein